jgi:eukaryotic-like serine/threonine-protein kinase
LSGATGELLQSYDEHPDMVCALTFSPDDSRIASASDDLDIRIWERATGKTVSIIHTGDIGMIASLSWSVDGSLLAAAGDEATLSVYDTSTGSKVVDYTGHMAMVNAVAWSPDGEYLATASDDCTVHVICKDQLITA